MKKLILLFFVGLSLNANAENWIDLSEEGNPMFFDKDSIISRYDPEGNLLVSMWVLNPSDQPLMHPDGAGTMMLQSANCTNMSIKIAEITEVDSAGTVVWRLSQDPMRNELAEAMPLDYYYPTPGDNFANNLKALCHPVTINYGFDNARI
ncbi:hypothetical protein [Psychrobacter sp. FDAARGOS_221]|uniref:hypothetical protein n=1 Tax=Psychrobacter sp. FDAARGOS_221 TaxID=1975705 RepID=UPI000BB56360|nr:hypothetical protein [Psychrobacter sp. FDAARGOS_221]PNK59510.1 hypothetical protein A6J60_000480 [Psychrobacter sp. FDAARGOS_221]